MVQTILWLIGGAVAGLVVVLLLRWRSYGDGPHWAVAALLLLVGLNAAWFSDRYMRHAHARSMTARVVGEMGDQPVFAAIRDADPKTYATMLKAIADTEPFPDDERAERSMRAVSPIMTEFMSTRIAHLDDHMTVRTARLGVGITKARLARTGTCDAPPTRYADAGRFGRWKDDLTPEENTMLRDYVAEVIRSEPDMTPSRYSAEQTKEIMTARLPLILPAAGIGPEDLPRLQQDRSGSCRVALILMDDIMSMPESQAAPILRSITNLSVTDR